MPQGVKRERERFGQVVWLPVEERVNQVWAGKSGRWSVGPWIEALETSSDGRPLPRNRLLMGPSYTFSTMVTFR